MSKNNKNSNFDNKLSNQLDLNSDDSDNFSENSDNFSDNSDNFSETKSSDNSDNLNIIDLDLELMPYITNNKSQIQKYHIMKKNGHTIKHRICNVFAPFGRQTSSDHKTNTSLNQHRLNICFNKSQIESEFKDKSYLELKRLITELESYFGTFDDLLEYELLSNIINRDKYGYVFRFHLKSNRDRTVTPLVQKMSTNSTESKIPTESNIPTESTEWINFDKTKKFNFNFHPDSLWIDHKNKRYGISLMIDKVFQII